MIRGLTTDLERDDATRHELLSASSAVAPLALVSAPQAVFEVTTLRDVVDANDGVLSLREAIGLANDSRGLDTITFADNLRGGTIVLARDQPLVITDNLVIDGDRLDGGAGGIVVSAQDWSGGGNTPSAVEIRGRTGEVSVSFEDLTVRGDSRMYLDSPVVSGERARIDLLRAEVGGYASAIVADGFVTLTDSTINGAATSAAIFSASGINSRTGISLVDSTVTNIWGIGVSAPNVSMLRSSIDNITHGFPIGIYSDNISVIESAITKISGYYGASVLLGSNIELINSTIADNHAGTNINWLGGASGSRVDSCSKRRGNCFQANLISMSLPRPLKKAWMGVR
jgi:hypothetical protein